MHSEAKEEILFKLLVLFVVDTLLLLNHQLLSTLFQNAVTQPILRFASHSGGSSSGQSGLPKRAEENSVHMDRPRTASRIHHESSHVDLTRV